MRICVLAVLITLVGLLDAGPRSGAEDKDEPEAPEFGLRHRRAGHPEGCRVVRVPDFGQPGAAVRTRFDLDLDLGFRQKDK